jgi:hypothetical protein
MQRRILELVGEEAEARNIGRPAPARRSKMQERHLDGIAGLRPLDVDRPRHRIDLSKIQRRDIGHRGGWRELTTRRVDGMEFHALPWRYACRGRIIPVPAEMALVDGVIVLMHVKPSVAFPPS